jgi:hypothetical protein
MTAISTTKRFALLLALMAAMLMACAGAASAKTLTSTVKQSGLLPGVFANDPVPINGSPYDYSGQDYASLVSIDQVSITLTITDGDTAVFDFDRDQLTLGLDGIDTGIKLNDFPTNQTTTQTITGVPNNAADILTALKADGQLNATVIDQSPGENILELPATQDTTLALGVDTTAPTTTVALDPATANGDNGWYKSAVKLTVSATDGSGSGVDETRCVLDPASVPTSFDDLPSSTCPYLGSGTNVSADGQHTLYAASIDEEGNKEPIVSKGFKIDKTPPSVSGCSVTPSRLKPPNHKMVTVTATAPTLTDPAGGSGPDGLTLLSVTSSQPDSGLGPDDVAGDIQDWSTGTNPADTGGQLRAERYGSARTYTLTYQGKDLAGNTKNCLATVTVPKGG